MAAALLLAVPGCGASAAQFASDVRLVEVYVSVADRGGAPIHALTAADFTVRDDGALQRITTFVAGTLPVSVALAIDRSFSMAGQRLAVARAASRAFVEGLGTADQVMVVAVGSDSAIVAPLSADRAAAVAAIAGLDAWGTTPLYDAVLRGIDAIAPARGRRALVLVSDGDDRSSRASAADAVAYARRHDVIVYPIAIGSARPAVFAEMAEATGGRSFFLRDGRGLDAALASIAEELRSQYLLGYTLARDPSSGWHAIDVAVDVPGARIRARDGYWTR